MKIVIIPDSFKGTLSSVEIWGVVSKACLLYTYEGFLISYDGAVVIVSHDRYFLDKICNKTFELENNKLKTYPGNYTYYKEKKEFDRLTLSRDYEKKSREIKRIEGIIEQQKRFNHERNYITIKIKQKQIDRIASELERPEDLSLIHI